MLNRMIYFKIPRAESGIWASARMMRPYKLWNALLRMATTLIFTAYRLSARSLLTNFQSLTVFSISLSFALAFGGSIHAQSTQSGIFVNATLHAPNYGNSTDVGRHAAFVNILARLLDSSFEQSRQPCSLSSSLNFPDLRLSLKVAGSTGSDALKQCLEHIERTLIGGNFDQASFDSAFREVVRFYTPVSLERSEIARTDLWATRLRLVSMQALRQLHQNDPVLYPLLTMHDQLLSQNVSFGSFVSWIADQRNLSRFGFYPPYELAAEQLRQWGLAVSPPPHRPVLRRGAIESSGELHVRAPGADGRSLVLISCHTARDRYCLDKLSRSFCFKAIDQKLGATPAHAPLRCRSINVEGLSEWLAAESDGEQVSKWFKEELSSARLSTIDLDPSAIDYVVLVTTK